MFCEFRYSDICLLPIPSLWRLSMRLWCSSNLFDFLHFDNSSVLNFTDQVMKKLSGFFTRGKGGLISLIMCSMLLDRDQRFLVDYLFDSIVPFLEFSIECQSNQLIYQKEYTKRQQVIYVLIKYLHDEEGFGYRKISQWLNNSGIFIDSQDSVEKKSWHLARVFLIYLYYLYDSSSILALRITNLLPSFVFIYAFG